MVAVATASLIVASTASGRCRAGGGLLGGKDPAGQYRPTVRNSGRLERRGFIDPPRSAERNDLDDDHFESDVAFIRQEVHAPGVLHESGARGVRVRREIVAFVE